MKITAIKLAKTMIENTFPSSRLCMNAMIPDCESTNMLPSPARTALNTTKSHRTELKPAERSFDSSNYGYCSQDSIFKNPWKTAHIITKPMILIGGMSVYLHSPLARLRHQFVKKRSTGVAQDEIVSINNSDKVEL